MDVVEIVKRDFDKISAVETPMRWDHNNHYHPFLLKQLPARGSVCMDIGCGTGAFSRILSRQYERVEAIDVSSGMIQKARDQSKGYSNITFIEGDILEYPVFENHYDSICSVATVHHLPLEQVLVFAQKALKPNGVLAILDLYEAEGPLEWLSSALAVPVNLICSAVKNKGQKQSPEEKKAWCEHSRNDHYLRSSEIQEIARRVMPGAVFKRHFFWRYSLVYKKP